MTGTGSCGITSTMSRIHFDLLDYAYKPGIPLFGRVRNFWDHGQWTVEQTYNCTIPSDGVVECYMVQVWHVHGAGYMVQEADDTWWRSQMKLAGGVKTTQELTILIDNFHGLTGLFSWEFSQLFPQTTQGIPHTFPHSFLLFFSIKRYPAWQGGKEGRGCITWELFFVANLKPEVCYCFVRWSWSMALMRHLPMKPSRLPWVETDTKGTTLQMSWDNPGFP